MAMLESYYWGFVDSSSIEIWPSSDEELLLMVVCYCYYGKIFALIYEFLFSRFSLFRSSSYIVSIVVGSNEDLTYGSGLKTCQ